MRWRFNGDTCCGCGGSAFTCCTGSITTHRDVNYIDSLIVRRQKTDLTWESREAVITPIEMFATGITHPTTSVNWQSPCAASNCKWDSPSGTVTDYGTGEWDQSFEFGSYDSLNSVWAWKFNRNDNASLFGAFDLRLPINILPQQCNPSESMIFKAGQPNDPGFWRKVEPPAMEAYLTQTTWDIQMANQPLWDTWGSITFRFPHLVNYCWPSRGSTSGITYCNFANTTFSSGVYFDGSTGINQSGTQSWTYDSVTQDQYLEIPFGGNTLQFRPSTVTGEDDILYMHINGGAFFAEKFTVSGTCNGNITWTSLNNPTHYVTFTLTNGETCNECGDNVIIATGCCTLPDGTVNPNSTSASCAAQGGTYGGDDSTCPATGCCAIVGSPDLSNVTQAHCTAQGGTWTEGAACGSLGWCINDTDGSVTSGVEENDCTGTWSATEPTMGCCEISGTQHANVAQSWCTTQSGTFNAGDCVAPEFDPCAEAWTIVSNGITIDMDDPFFDLADPLTMSGGVWVQPVNAFRHDVCSSFGALLQASTVNVNGDNTANPTQISVASTTSVKYNSGTGNWDVETYITWTYQSNTYTITATKNNISLPSAGCPSFTVSGTYDSFVSNYSQIGNGFIFDQDDMVGSFNLTLTCE